MLPAFTEILSKNTQVLETQEFRASFFREATYKRGLVENSETITCYRGKISEPKFVDQDGGNFYDVFEIRADVSSLVDKLKPSIGKNRSRFFEIEYDIIILFGLTEFKAQFAWMENGVEKRGPAQILFDTEIEYRI